MVNNFYVYEHWRLDRDECFYVGKGKGNRAYSLKNRNRHHQAIMAKLSRIGSSMEVRIVVDGLSQERAFDLEIERIAFWRGAGVDLANIMQGGDGGMQHSDETRAKISKAIKGRTLSLEHRTKIGVAHKGRKHSEEHTAKMAATKIGNLYAKGRVLSETTKNKIRQSLSGRTLPESTKLKISEAGRGRRHSEESIKRMCEAQKGNKHWLGKSHSNETKLRMSIARKAYWADRKQGAL